MRPIARIDDERSDLTGIVLVRHAATAWSGVRYCGRSDPPLSAAGRAGAIVLATDLAGTLPPGVRLVSSSSRRARQTAEAIAVAAGITSVPVDDRWREAHFGIAEGMTFDALDDVAPDIARRLAAGETEIDWPDGERAAELAARVGAAWLDVLERAQPTVVVSHAGPLRIAVGLARGVAAADVEFPATGAVVRLGGDATV